MPDTGDRQPEQEPPAGRHTQLVDPVLTVRPLSRFDFNLRSAVRIDVGLVFVTPDGGYDTYLPPQRPMRTQMVVKRYAVVYEVDMGVHSFSTELALPSDNDAFEFTAAVDVSWQCLEPARFVATGHRDVPRLLLGELQQAARRVTRRFAIAASAQAEHALLQEKTTWQPLGSAAGLQVTWTLRLKRDQENIDHQRRLQTIQHQEALAFVREQHELAAQQQLPLEQLKIEFYQYYLENGGVHAWALHLAAHPEDSRLVMDSMSDDQIRFVQARLETALQSLIGDTAESHELDASKQSALRAVSDILDQRFAGASPVSPPLRQGVAPIYPGSSPSAGHGTMESRRLVAELAEQAPPGREVPLQVQIIQERGDVGVALRGFAVPAQGMRLLITVHAPGLLALGDLQQELTIVPGCDSDVVRFGLRTTITGLHTVTVRVFCGGSFLGELRTQISVEADVPTRDGPAHSSPLNSLAFDPGEVTLQVLKTEDGAYSFQLLGETSYAPETFRLRAGDPERITGYIYQELRSSAAAAHQIDGRQARERLRNLGVSLWADAVPEAVRRQFWEEADRIRAFTVLGEHDVVPWELLYPIDGAQEGDGFLAEWLPIVRRVFGQSRVRELPIPKVAFVIPPGSPPEAAQEVAALRAKFDSTITDVGTLTRRSQVQDLVNAGMAGLLHFACHNTFTERGSRVAMEDGGFDPIDLAYARRTGALRDTRPLVFFNACRSAGEINWYSSSLGWAPQFLRAGAGAFVGTLWPVRSDSALMFADTFYHHLVREHLPLGEASMKARRAIRNHGGDPTWLAYAVYGSPAARVTIA
ncbi:CHAT domain-containing protein [Streptomyces sp. NPDC052301]|uniref:CHAT domain-containing protein n=1 Tax=Streptomyces sp. NPDC052301 TaxID=3365687 RepID=UPI0037D0EEEA